MKHVLTIPDWTPARLNQFDGRHWAVRANLKKADRQLVMIYFLTSQIPSARGKRRVSLDIMLGKHRRLSDPDAHWKSLLDALVHASLLVNDNPAGVELGPVTITKGPRTCTTITLEDV